MRTDNQHVNQKAKIKTNLNNKEVNKIVLFKLIIFSLLIQIHQIKLNRA